MKKGDRIRVTELITPGVGAPPAPGTLGTVEIQREDGTVVVALDDGRRAILASWEVASLSEEN